MNGLMRAGSFRLMPAAFNRCPRRVVDSYLVAFPCRAKQAQHISIDTNMDILLARGVPGAACVRSVPWAAALGRRASFERTCQRRIMGIVLNGHDCSPRYSRRHNGNVKRFVSRITPL